MASTDNITFPSKPHTHSEYLPLKGGLMIGQITYAHHGTAFYAGREGALIRDTYNGDPGAFQSLISNKTPNGTFDIGCVGDDLYFVYVKDTDYNSKTNAYTLIKFSHDGYIEAANLSR